jgi:hypothetical protein
MLDPSVGVILIAISGAFALLIREMDKLVAPIVVGTSSPEENEKRLEIQVVEFLFTPLLRTLSKAPDPLPRRDISYVKNRYNASVAHLQEAKSSRIEYESAKLTLRRFLVMCALSLVIFGALTLALSIPGVSPDEPGYVPLVILIGFLLAFISSLSVSIYAWFLTRKARRRYREALKEVERTLRSSDYKRGG